MGLLLEMDAGETNQLNANAAITQNVFVVKQFEKSDKLSELLETLSTDAASSGEHTES